MIYQSEKELSVLIMTVNEAYKFIDDPEKQMKEQPEEFGQILGFTAGASIGATASLAALYTAGVAGLSAAGITSGLAAIGGTMLGGVAALAAFPIAMAIGGFFALKWLTSESLEEKKEKLLKNCKEILPEMKKKTKGFLKRKTKKQAKNFIILLNAGINDLQKDTLEQ